jgi:signal transduction histidine kinase
LVNRARDGSRLTVASRWLLHRDAKGIPSRILEVDADITLRRKMEEEIRNWNIGLEQRVAHRTAELSEAKERAESSDHAKSEFLANMSHELRTPLNAVIGFAELLVDGRAGPLNEIQREYLEDISTSGRHLLKLITDVLDLTRAATGKLELNLETFSINDAIGEVYAAIKDEASRKCIVVTVEDGLLDGVVVRLDRLRFKQILYNLLSNAVKFTPDHGKIRVTAAIDNQNRLRLNVNDTGIGIEKADMPRIFHDFEQIDSSFAKRAQGSGLGLALTKRLVELQKGSVTAESEVGKGSTFTVVLPIALESELAVDRG